MRWKDLSINTKLSIGFGIILIFLTVIGGFSWYGFNTFSTEVAHEKIRIAVIEEMTAKEIDHLQWSASISKIFIDDNQKSLTTQHDRTKCNLGKWLYGEGRKKAVADMPEIAGLVKEMEEPHKRLHASITEMNKIIAQHNGDRDAFLSPVRDVYNSRTLPELNTVREKLKSIASDMKDEVENLEEHIIDLSNKLQ